MVPIPCLGWTQKYSIWPYGTVIRIHKRSYLKIIEVCVLRTWLLRKLCILSENINVKMIAMLIEQERPNSNNFHYNSFGWFHHVGWGVGQHWISWCRRKWNFVCYNKESSIQLSKKTWSCDLGGNLRSKSLILLVYYKVLIVSNFVDLRYDAIVNLCAHISIFTQGADFVLEKVAFSLNVLRLHKSNSLRCRNFIWMVGNI